MESTRRLGRTREGVREVRQAQIRAPTRKASATCNFPYMALLSELRTDEGKRRLGPKG